METLDRFKEIIEKRALKRATDEVNELQNVMYKSGLLEIKIEFFVTQKEVSTKTLRESFWTIGALDEKKPNPLNILRKEKYEKYLVDETDKFIKQIDTLSSQAEELLSIKDNIGNY